MKVRKDLDALAMGSRFMASNAEQKIVVVALDVLLASELGTEQSDVDAVLRGFEEMDENTEPSPKRLLRLPMEGLISSLLRLVKDGPSRNNRKCSIVTLASSPRKIQRLQDPSTCSLL